MRSLLLVLAACAALLAVGHTAGAAAPRAQAARACSGVIRNYSGAIYMQRFRASHISCRTSKAVAKAFQRCRPRGKGRCTHRVYGGYRCTEKRSYGYATFDSYVTCKRGARVAKHLYEAGF